MVVLVFLKRIKPKTDSVFKIVINSASLSQKVFHRIVVVVNTFYSSSSLGQETAKEPSGSRLNLLSVLLDLKSSRGVNGPTSSGPNPARIRKLLRSRTHARKNPKLS